VKAKKILFLVVLTLVLLVAVVETGTALAGPAGPITHHVRVTGTVVGIALVGPAPVLDPAGTTWHEDSAWTGTFLGDLQGTFTEPTTIHGRFPWEGPFWWRGAATFTGKLGEAAITFTYNDHGKGYDGFNSTAKFGIYEKVRAVYTITGATTDPFRHLRGMIYVRTYVDGTGTGGTTYSGELSW
jgi:hypothetical protein